MQIFSSVFCRFDHRAGATGCAINGKPTTKGISISIGILWKGDPVADESEAKAVKPQLDELANDGTSHEGDNLPSESNPSSSQDTLSQPQSTPPIDAKQSHTEDRSLVINMDDARLRTESIMKELFALPLQAVQGSKSTACQFPLLMASFLIGFSISKL